MYLALMPVTTAPNRPSLSASAQVFHALSDETRLAVLDMLRDGERCVCELQAALDAAQSRLSFHLKVLRDAGLVRDRKEGRWSYYALNADRLADAEAYLSELQQAQPASGGLVTLRRSTSTPPAARRVARALPRSGRRDSECCT